MLSGQCLTLEGVEDAEGEVDDVRERPKVQEAQPPGGPKQAAQAPDAEEGHTVLLPLRPVLYLLHNQAQHQQARENHQCQE